MQVQSLFLAQPRLLELIVRVMAYAPRFAQTLARQPAALDALLDPAFFAPFQPLGAPSPQLAGAEGFEAAMEAARRLHRERTFQIGLQVLAGAASATAAGEAFAELADVCVAGLAQAALAEVGRQAGAFPGEVAVIALGKCGSREMSASSDLDLMTLYRANAPDAASAEKGWAAETFYGRFTGRLITALSAPTAQGELYEVDMRLRPSGTAGPVAVSFAAFEGYYAEVAETWEYLALTRARPVWATSDAFAAQRRRGDRGGAARAEGRRQDRGRRAGDAPADGARAAGVRLLGPEAARGRPRRHRVRRPVPAAGPCRRRRAAQPEHRGRPGRAHRGRPGVAGAARATSAAAWRLQQDLSQLLKVALAEDASPDAEPKALRALLAKAGGARDDRSLRTLLTSRRHAAHQAFLKLIAGERATVAATD